MGRYPWSNRTTVEECRVLNVFNMTRDGVFKKGPGNSWISKWINSRGEETNSIGYWVHKNNIGGLYLELQYTITKKSSGETEEMVYRVNLERTSCNFGGFRYWFICPLVENGKPCQRRAGKLYLPPGGKYFGCRQCYNLTYSSQKDHDKTADFYRKNPAVLLHRLENDDPKAALVALKCFINL